MQTCLPNNLLATPEGARAEEILRTCVHWGMWSAVWPTDGLLGDELDGPRGRIYLIKGLLENGEDKRGRCPHGAHAFGPLPNLPSLRNSLPVWRAIRRTA